MAPTRQDFEQAIADYWKKKDDQRATALANKSTAEGTAGAIRGGKHFGPISDLLARFFLDAGYPTESIGITKRQTALPGYFRPTKDWDLVVIHRRTLVAAIELKALGGPSFGNNYNNRVEEALGSAVDLAYGNKAGLVGLEKPWTGYFFVMEDAEGSRRTSRPQPAPTPTSFAPDAIWNTMSYQERFGLTGERLLNEKLYDAVCYCVSSPDDPGPREPSRLLDWQHFSAAIEARLEYLRRLGFPGN